MATIYERLDKDKAGTRKTVFTHYFDAKGKQLVDLGTEHYDRIVYLGWCGEDGDMFAAYNGDVIDTLYGTLGDEFK